MSDSWHDILRRCWQKSVPFVITFILMAVFAVPFSSFQMNFFRPTVGIIGVYYWAFRQGLVGSYLLAFLVGLIIDVHSSSPIGINVVCVLFFALLIRQFSRYLLNMSFYANWFFFALFGLFFILLKWIMLMMYYGKILLLSEAFINFSATMMFYPLVVYLNALAQNKFITMEQSDEQN